ncbi:hypothetical protein C7B62_14080 [Pleurocapsa sp. CCALA 161]|uniref:EVE domain-containing protein n=1 Tax=Pleurocapsa sp. CCALA 161 TaxID=2107688 RepID=UPI000D05931C|nr:EVE domain-containing protein [Pleurocapsa sp. CCALA 161]PSB09194.1 hypothetical protein C7B62_14080 [Pleurocapsa sp. CCALA 161]
MKHSINTVSKNYIIVGKEESFVQAGHGKETPLKKLQPVDYIIFYSPKTSLQNGKPIQAFTAVVTIKDRDIYQVVEPRSLSAISPKC